MSEEHTIEYDSRYNKWNVYAWGVYPRHSVLAGQTMKRFVNSYKTKEEAEKAYPKADENYRSAHNTYSHLPDEDDLVPGGMYPDDYDDGY